jgi:hypothetical protein
MKSKKVLENFSICTSNFDRAETEKIKGKVEKLGGTFQEDMRKSTNILISSKINTHKCIVSIKKLTLGSKKG